MSEQLSHFAALAVLGSVALVALGSAVAGIRADRRSLPAEPHRGARRVRGYVGKGARHAR